MRQGRTARPDELVGKRVALVFRVGGIDSGRTCRVKGHKNGWFDIETDSAPSYQEKARRTWFVVLS